MTRLVLVGYSAALATGAVHRHATVNKHSTVRDSIALDLDASADVMATMDAVAGAWLSDRESAPSVPQVLRTVTDKMDVATAVEKVAHKQLPEDVAALVKTATSTKSTQPFSEASLDKARVVLNGLVEARWQVLSRWSRSLQPLRPPLQRS